MIDWHDDGIILQARRHGENAAIVTVFTRDHGKISGLVHGGAGRRLQPVLQPGTDVSLHYRSRIESQLGTLSIELKRARSHHALASRLGLEGLNCITALLLRSLPEGEAQPALFAASSHLLDLIGFQDGWENLFPLAYVQWERHLLQTAGFALTLESCAVSGDLEDLRYVSPRSGRAVSAKAAGDWAERLLPLSPALIGQGAASPQDIKAALHTTGYFLQHRLFDGEALPDARTRLKAAIARL